MDKTLKPSQVNKPGNLVAAEAPIRAIVLKDLPKPKRLKVMENLVESAMVMGLWDEYQIKKWLGIKSIAIKSITAARDKVKERWVEETSDDIEYARMQRAVQINKAWDEVRTCEKLFEEAESINDRVKVKKLQLEWMQYVSKLSFVDKLVETAQSDMSIIVNGGMTVKAKDDN